MAVLPSRDGRRYEVINELVPPKEGEPADVQSVYKIDGVIVSPEEFKAAYERQAVIDAPAAE